MSERPQAEPSPGAWHVQLSKLLMILFLVAVAATGGLLVTLVIGLTESPPNGRLGPNGMPPPPPDMRIIETITFMTGVFVLAWLAVLVVFVRDQILQRLREHPITGGVGREELAGLLGELRSQLTEDQAALGDRLAEVTGEYGERRETDGYLSGMRMATGDEPSPGNVRALRRTPPQH
jgi:hypothetical protein